MHHIIRLALIIAIGSYITMVTFLLQTKISGIVQSTNGDTWYGHFTLKGAMDGAIQCERGMFQFNTTLSSRNFGSEQFGYELHEREIILNGKTVEVELKLSEKANELNTAIITAGTFEAGDEKKIEVLNSIDVATTAGATADVYGALKTLPGALPTMEADGMFVRGGDASESVTYLDDVAIANPYTSNLPDVAQRGRFSPFMLKGTAFSSGGYSAAYGNALSAVVLLNSKDVAPKSKSGIDIMSVGLSGNHIQHFKNSSIEFNGGYYNLKPIFSLVKQNITWTKEPEQVEANASYKVKFNNNGLLKVYADYSNSKTGIITDNIYDITRQVNYKIRSNNFLVNSSYSQFLNENWKLLSAVGFSIDDQHIGIDDDKVIQTENAFHMRTAVTNYFGKLSQATFGVEFNHSNFDEAYNLKKHAIGQDAAAVYAEAEFYITNKLAVRTGVRSEFAEVISETNVAPRLAAAYKFSDASQFSLAYGMFYQVPGKEFLFATKALNFETARHFIANYQYQENNRTLRLEAYYKTYNHLVSYNETRENEITNSGYGYAKGIDIFWRDKQTWKRSDYWISYSFIDTRRKYLDYPVEAQPPFVASHVFNIVYKYMIPKWNTYIGATYTFASGRTYYNPNNNDFLSDRTKSYNNFSLNVSYLTSIAKQFTIVYLSVENIFGIGNIYGYRYSPDGSVKKPVVPSAPRAIFAGVFITLGDDSFR